MPGGSLFRLDKALYKTAGQTNIRVCSYSTNLILPVEMKGLNEHRSHLPFQLGGLPAANQLIGFRWTPEPVAHIVTDTGNPSFTVLPRTKHTR